MKKILIPGLLAGALFLNGCASTSQHGTQTKDGGKSLDMHSFALFQSDQAVGKLRQSNGQVLTQGAEDIAQKADAAAFMQVLGNVLLQGMMTYMSGGAVHPGTGTAVVPTTTTPAVPVYNPADKSTWPSKVTPDGSGTVTVCYPNGACVYGVPITTITNNLLTLPLK